MKVLIIRAFPSYIDLKKNCYNQQEIGLAKAMLSQGKQVGIVYFGGESHKDCTFDSEGGKIAIYYRKAKVFLNKIAFYERFDDLKADYDLLILNEYDQLETYKTLRKFFSKSVIYHGPYYDPFNKRYNIYNKLYDFLFLKKIKKISPVIFTKSKLAKEFLEGKGLVVKDYLGVGLDETQMKISNEQYHESDANRIRLLYIGKIEPRRNPIFLINVLEELNRRNKNKYSLTIIGTGEIAEVSKLLLAINEKGLSQYITYIEKMTQQELPQIYSSSNIFLLPTSYEIWGMVLMEAMKFDLPVFTTYNGGSSSLIKQGINGEILELKVNDWVNAIENVIYDKESLHEYNQKILDEKCSWSNIANRIIKLFEE